MEPLTPTSGRKTIGKRKASDLIKHLPSRNFHHGIRLAKSIGFELNCLISINFFLTSCPPEKVDIALAEIRAHFGKWITRPKKSCAAAAAPPTFVWVIENPDGCVNAHWLAHIPPSRQREFAVKLDKWLLAAAGKVYSDKAIDIRPAKTPTAAGKYMLKGLHPSLAREYGIRHVYQGWVTGKRIGCSMNIGPAQLARMRKLGRHPAASRWIHGKYSRNQNSQQAFGNKSEAQQEGQVLNERHGAPPGYLYSYADEQRNEGGL